LQKEARLRLSCDNCHYEWNTKLKFFPIGGKNAKEYYSNSRCPACKTGITVTQLEDESFEIHGGHAVQIS
jgi:hypothetical protein